jgi:hypothetical protein
MPSRASLALIEGATPQGEIESALVLQMACTHAAAMAVLGRLGAGHGTDGTIAANASAVSRLLGTDVRPPRWARCWPAGLGTVGAD